MECESREIIIDFTISIGNKDTSWPHGAENEGKSFSQIKGTWLLVCVSGVTGIDDVSEVTLYDGSGPYSRPIAL